MSRLDYPGALVGKENLLAICSLALTGFKRLEDHKLGRPL